MSTIPNSLFTPFYVFWELTHQCNLDCAHCYIERDPRPEISLRSASRLIRSLRKMNALVISFSGGEVLLRSDFLELALIAKRENFGVKIFTNGTLVDESCVKVLKKINPVRIDISLYSKRPDIHDRITGKRGSWDQSYRAIQVLLKHGLKVAIKCSLLKENCDAFSETLDFFKSMGIPFQVNPILMPSTDRRRKIMQHSPDSNKMRSLVKTILSVPPRSACREEELDKPMCSAGIHSLAINAYGDVWPCIAFPVRLGNILETDIGDIWNKSAFLRELRGMKKRDLPSCGGCENLEYCSRCPGIAYRKTGNYRDKYEEACRLAEARASFAVDSEKICV